MTTTISLVQTPAHGSAFRDFVRSSTVLGLLSHAEDAVWRMARSHSRDAWLLARLDLQRLVDAVLVLTPGDSPALDQVEDLLTAIAELP